MKRLGFLIVLLLVIAQIFGGLVNAKELKKMLKDDNVIIISGRNPSDYDSKHIRGAINLYHKDLYKPEGVDAMLKTPEEIAAILGAKGISESSKVVIYDDGSNKMAGRLYWILQYMGMEDVHILDGHLKAWFKSRGPITSKAPQLKAVTFTPQINEDIYASMDYVKKNLNNSNVILVDVRSAEEYRGETEDENLTRLGHIPGAINFEYSNILNDDETLKSKEDIMSLLKTAGITGDKEIILYCATSVRAGIVYMALTSILDYPAVRVFDGAFYEWESDSSSSIE